MAKEYLDQTGLSYFWGKVKDYVDNNSGGGGGDSGIELLWSNPSPSSAFDAQTISIDMSRYGAVIIRLRASTTGGQYTNNIVMKGTSETGNTSLFIRAYSSSNMFTRGAKLVNEGVIFTTGYQNGTAGTGYAIPVSIYGIANLNTTVNSGQITGTNGTINYYKTGNVVTVSINSENSSTTGGWFNVGTLPEGFRPPIDIRFAGYNNAANASTISQALEECSITTEGVVRWYPFFSSHQCRGSVTYIVDPSN